MKNWLADSSGNVAIIFALSISGLLAAGSVAIDLARLNSSQAELFAAMDSSVLAGTREIMDSGSSTKALAAARQYFDSAITNTSAYSELDIKFKLNKARNGVASFGNAKIKTTFLGIFGLQEFDVVSVSREELVSAEGLPPGGVENLEVSLMLDVTGSMCDDGSGPCTSGSKMVALKDAANSLVEELLPSPSPDYTVKIALVPFSTRVRLAADGAGGGIMTAVTNLPATWSGYYNRCIINSGSTGSETSNFVCTAHQPVTATDWKIMPCVTDRFNSSNDSFGLTDARPAQGTWLNAHDGNRMPLYSDINDTPATIDTGTSMADLAFHWTYNPAGNCADIGNSNTVVPLTDSESRLETAISGLSAYGATAGVLGTAMTWYTLSPEWAGIWGGSSAPRPYSELQEEGESGAKKLRKIAVLMTDGGYNTYIGRKGSSISLLSEKATEVCENMKSAGVEVFTVGFELGTLTSVEEGYANDTLSSCASDSSHFFNADSSAELVKAFEDIAGQLTAGGVRLIK